MTDASLYLFTAEWKVFVYILIAHWDSNCCFSRAMLQWHFRQWDWWKRRDVSDKVSVRRAESSHGLLKLSSYKNVFSSH